MKKAMFLLVCMFTSIFLIQSYPTVVNACSCVEMPSVDDQFDRSDAVFSGEVLNVREERYSDGSASKVVQFEVTNTWKGINESQVEIKTGLGGGDCGINFSVGTEYLVYANESSMYGTNALVSIICDRTNELSLVTEDLDILGVGESPPIQTDVIKTNNVNYLIGVIGITTVLVVLGIVLFVLRNKRK